MDNTNIPDDGVTGGTGNTEDGGKTPEVVMRRPKNVFEPAYRDSDRVESKKDGKKPGEKEKRVKWSESTELREKMKVYRRSQLDIPLDYHHIAVEEQREKEGVKVWRSSLRGEDDDEEIELKISPLAATVPAAASFCTDEAIFVEENSESTDSDAGDPLLDLDLDKMLHVIKIKTTKYTVYPAYCAAVVAYEEWLSKKDNTNDLSDDRIANMRSQLELYKRIVCLYEQWSDQDDDDTACSRYEEISSLLQKATDLGAAPQNVTKLITEVINDEENAQKQVDVYNNMVQEMISTLDTAIEV
ncbi:unnamed protein product [Lymnaea stagnalis]|uniref:Peroxin-19 n=1 Tax=Lymnaea stagnalis TaxID=6523 RepID=A0AAV2HNI3_LYMST